MRFTYQAGERTCTLDIDKTAEGYVATVDGKSWPVEVERAEDGELYFLVSDRRVAGFAASDGTRRWVFVDGRPWVFDASTSVARERLRGGPGHGGAGERLVTSPMPGQVRAVQVEEGAGVEKGQTLLLLEAMKMEIRVQAPRPGLVARLLVQKGQTVERDQALVELEE